MNTDEAVVLAPARGAFDQDWRKLVNWGLICALALIFVSLTDMPDKLDKRVIVEPLLSMGYLSLIWIPVALGNFVTREVVLEGMTQHKKGLRELVAGISVGAIGGAGLALLIWLLDTRDLSDPLVNWNDALLEVLSFGEGVGYGAIFWILASAGLGLAGGALHLLPAIANRLLLAISLTIVLTASLESALDDISEGFRLEWLFEALFEKKGGLSVQGAVILTVFAIAWVLVLGGQAKRGRAGSGGSSRAVPDEGQHRGAGAHRRRCGCAPDVPRSTHQRPVDQCRALPASGARSQHRGRPRRHLDLGYVAFFAVGGYTAAIMTSPSSPGLSPELPWWVAIFVVVFMAIVAGLFIGAPVIRMRGDYLAIVTLGFGEIIRLTVRSDWASGFTGGAQGILSIPGADIVGVATVKGTDPQQVLYLVIGFVAIAIYVSWRLENSRIGRAWMAVREDESVAEAMGINTVNSKLQAFVVGAILASFSGAIFAAKVGSVFESSFKILVSIVILVIVIVGGMGRIAGVAAGALVLVGILGGPNQPGLLAEFSEFKLLIYGALLIWMMLKRPEGLIPNVRRSRELHQEEFLQDAWLKAQANDDDDEAASGEVAPA
jgi:branched-chain amino acid transport system permease protein